MSRKKNNKNIIDENIIVCLFINKNNLPDPYNQSYYCNLISEKVDNKTIEQNKVNILDTFKQKNKDGEWLENTSILCYWCCHSFDGKPFGIPVKYINNVFSVYGCFCSLECACAYNFKTQLCVDEMWERYNLLNLFYRKISNDNTCIIPAPDRLVLKIFGGYFSIEEFREYTKSGKMINIVFPPMSVLIQQIEEINQSDIGGRSNYIPIDYERVAQYEKKILKRQKSVINEINNIETFMTV